MTVSSCHKLHFVWRQMSVLCRSALTKDSLLQWFGSEANWTCLVSGHHFWVKKKKNQCVYLTSGTYQWPSTNQRICPVEGDLRRFYPCEIRWLWFLLENEGHGFSLLLFFIFFFLNPIPGIFFLQNKLFWSIIWHETWRESNSAKATS